LLFSFLDIKSSFCCAKQKTLCGHIPQHSHMVVMLQSSFCVINVQCFQQVEVLAYPVLHIQVKCDALSDRCLASHSFSAEVKILYTVKLVPHLHLDSSIWSYTSTPLYTLMATLGQTYLSPSNKTHFYV
jgi:hypothetical protein